MCFLGKLAEQSRSKKHNRRLGGIINAVDPNREIGFGFVSCSCRACVRAGEAKLRGRARGDVLPNAGGSDGNIFCGGFSGGGCGLATFADMCKGF